MSVVDRGDNYALKIHYYMTSLSPMHVQTFPENSMFWCNHLDVLSLIKVMNNLKVLLNLGTFKRIAKSSRSRHYSTHSIGMHISVILK